MDKTKISDFKALFITTARKHIETIRLSLDVLQKNFFDFEAINRIYIASHSFKGESLAMGYMTNASIAQLIERIFHAAKDRKLVLNPQILTAVLRSVAKLSESVDCVEKEDKECIFSNERMELEKVTGISGE